MQLNDTYIELGAIATDNYDQSVSVSISGVVNTSIPGTYSKTYSATDSSGNTGINSRTILVENNNLPVITLIGSNPVNLSVGQSYVDSGATAVDALGQTLVVSTFNNINKDVLGIYIATVRRFW